MQPGIIGIPGGTRGLEAAPANGSSPKAIAGLPGGGTRGLGSIPRAIPQSMSPKSAPPQKSVHGHQPPVSVGPGTHDAISVMQNGSALWLYDQNAKYGFKKPFDFRMFKLAGKRDAICYPDPANAPFGKIYLHSILDVVPGYNQAIDTFTAGMKRYSFVIVYKLGREKKTLHMVAARKVDFIAWSEGLKQLLQNPFLVKFPIHVAEDPSREPLLPVPEMTAKDRFMAITQEVLLSCITLGGYSPWACYYGCKGEILLDSRQIIEKRVSRVEEMMQEVGKLLTNAVFLLHEFRPVALEKMNYVREKLRAAESNGLFGQLDNDLADNSREVLLAAAEATALYTFMAMMKLQLENPHKYDKSRLLI